MEVNQKNRTDLKEEEEDNGPVFSPEAQANSSTNALAALANTFPPGLWNPPGHGQSFGLGESSAMGNGHQFSSILGMPSAAAVPAYGEPKRPVVASRKSNGKQTEDNYERISESMKFLQDLVPGCSKVIGKALMLDEISNYVQSLQRQVEFLSMKLSHDVNREYKYVLVKEGSGISDDSREMAQINAASNVLEKILFDGSAEPTNLPLALLQHITEDFAVNREIGNGAFGLVYKGDLKNGSVAVKRLLNTKTIEEEPFNREATSLIGVKHQNIVRFLGYCANTENQAMVLPEFGNKLIFAEIRERILCFEYISNGSLDKYLTDELRGLEWHIRYNIIRGICDGLVYLHNEKGIVHRDMKPGNILLTDLMIPKITDFGISKFLDGATHAVTDNSTGTPGYCAPELITQGVVSIKSDTYSLGVIIEEIVTGRKHNPDIKHALRRWRYRWNKSEKNPPMGSEQVTKCIEIAIKCVSKSPKERPYAWDIVSMLNELESTDEHVNNADESPVAGPISPYEWELLEFDLLELNFPFEINRQIPCSLQLTNVVDDYVAFHIELPTGFLQYRAEPEKGVVSPGSKCNVVVALQAMGRAPYAMTCKDDFVIVRCAIVDKGFKTEHITKGMFDKRSGKVVDEVTLNVIV